MERKYPALLSISEIGKLAKVNPKSIRYYEQIGIFKPARIDPDSGYRYYSPEQIHHLFAIKTCIHFGIPLRDFPNYCKDGILYTNRYLEDAATNFRQSIRRMTENLTMLENFQNVIRQSDRLKGSSSPLALEQPERTFLIREISHGLSLHTLFDVYTDLHLTAIEKLVDTHPFYGRIAVFRRGQLEHLYAAIHISRDTEGLRTLTLPEGLHPSLFTEESRILQAPELFSRQGSEQMLVFESSCVTSQHNIVSPGYILQCINL